MRKIAFARATRARVCRERVRTTANCCFLASDSSSQIGSHLLSISLRHAECLYGVVCLLPLQDTTAESVLLE